MSRSTGFELRPVDRLLRRRHAQGFCTALAAVIGAGLLFAVSPSVHTPRELLQMLFHRAGIFALFGGLFAIGGWWTVHTWRALWRRGRSSRERLLYDEGVRLVGFIQGVVIFIVVTWLGLTADAPQLWGPMTRGEPLRRSSLASPWHSILATSAAAPLPASSVRNRIRHSRSGSLPPSPMKNPFEREAWLMIGIPIAVFAIGLIAAVIAPLLR